MDPFHKCGCGRGFTREEWSALPDHKTYVDMEGSLVEHRRCPCASHVSRYLLKALDAAELRRAVRVVDGMNETFNQSYTAPELLMLVRACWLSKWDITPDGWTVQQCADALASGVVPDFEDDGAHALNVSDCRCRRCRVDARAG